MAWLAVVSVSKVGSGVRPARAWDGMGWGGAWLATTLMLEVGSPTGVERRGTVHERGWERKRGEDGGEKENGPPVRPERR